MRIKSRNIIFNKIKDIKKQTRLRHCCIKTYRLLKIIADCFDMPV